MVVPSLLFLPLVALGVTANIHAHMHQARQTPKTPVNITSIVKQINETSGQFGVSAAGNLAPFGEVGLGCGINWEQGKSFGGGLQAGAGAIGLGGGFTATPDNLEIGLGATGNHNTSANIQLSVANNGTVSFTFGSSAKILCVPTDNGNGIKCSSAPGP